MSNFKKMLLVPYEKNEIAQATRRSELDVKMLKVLQRTDIDDRTKFKLYQRLLELYLRHNQDKQMNNKTFESNAAQTDNIQQLNFATQTDPMKKTANIQTSPEKIDIDAQTSFE